MIRFETRIHQLNKTVDLTSGFDMFSILCSDFKVTFLIYMGILLCEFNMKNLIFFKNGTINKYERFHFKPNFATYKATVHVNSIPTLEIQFSNINASCSILNKICNVISIKSYLFISLEYFKLN